MFVIGILVSYYLYRAVNMIHRFSTTGILPREKFRKRMRRFIIFLVVLGVIFLTVYVICVCRFYKLEDYDKLVFCNKTFVIIRAMAMSLEVMLLSAMIWKLKRAKVTRTNSGHLKVFDASLLLTLQLLMIVTGLIAGLVFDAHH